MKDRARISYVSDGDGTATLTAHVEPHMAAEMRNRDLNRIRRSMLRDPELGYVISEDDYECFIIREPDGRVREFTISVVFNALMTSETQIRIIEALKYALMPFVMITCIDMTQASAR